jgi:TRAP transporter 4TM/12TM fusion protein
MERLKALVWPDSRESLRDLRERVFPMDQYRPTGTLGYAVSAACIALTLITLYMAFTVTIGNLPTRALHLAFAIPLIFLLYPACEKWRGRGPTALDWLLAALALAAFVWALYSARRYAERMHFFDELELGDLVFGTIALISVLEATRRTVGMIVVWITIFFAIYALTGPVWPNLFQHKGTTPTAMIEFLFMLDEGLFNFLMGIMATYLFTFLAFAAFLQVSGGDRIFTDLAMAVAGDKRGGPAKVAVLSSGLMGMLSGSSISNVITTGTFTIPLMKRTGFKPHEAAAIETTASVGGSLMPPVMGAGVFIMAEFTSVPLVTILLYSILPAILYYASIYFYVDAKARKAGMRGLDKADLPSLKTVLLRGGHIFLPVFVLVWLLLLNYTPYFASAVCVLLSFLVSFLRKETRMTLPRILIAFEAATRIAITVTSLLASAAIIYGVIVLTGLLFKVTSIILAFSFGSLFICIVLICALSYVLGMGLPTTAAYILVAALAAPALSELGTTLLAAHLIIYWFSQDSSITPPVAMTAFVAAKIAGADPHRTGFQSVMIAKALYIIPFVFAYGSLLDPAPVEVVFDFAVLMAMFFLMPMVFEGYWRRPLTFAERVLFLVPAALFFTATVGSWDQGLPWLAGGAITTGLVMFMVSRGGRASVARPTAP